MDKVKKFLEGYVQWLALALGVAFLGYNIYFYVLDKPVSVPTVGPNTNVSPSEVDKLVWDGPGTTLDNALKSKVPVAVTPMKPNLTTDAVDILNPQPTEAFTNSYIPAGVSPLIDNDEESHPIDREKLAVKFLPTLPPLEKLQMSFGHSNVPGPVPPAGQQQNTAVVAVDKNWISVESTVPTAAIAKAFNDAKIPKNLQNTTMLRVYLVREEHNRDGTWSAPTTMPVLEGNELKDLPSNSDPQDSQNDYKAWADTQSNVVLICQPPFYKVIQGNVWYEPGTANPNEDNQALIDDGFDPLHPENFKGDPNKLTPLHKKEYDEYLKHKAAVDKAKQQNNRPPSNYPNPGAPPGQGIGGNNGGNSGGGGGGGGGRGRRLGDDPRRGEPGDILRPPGYQNQPPYPGQPYGQANQPGAPNTAAAQAGLPLGSFDPSQLAPFKVWAHDSTAIPGHTYHYMMKYVVSSPVWHSTNLCDPQSLANTFSITSPNSAWTDPINVEADTNFYAVSVKGHGIEFQIFKWKNGFWQMQDVPQALDGDMIGSVDSSGKTDFTTGWTLVDIRDDPRDDTNKILVLVSESGAIKKKELNLDQRSALYQHLLDEVHKTNAAAPGAAPPGGNG
jgi:hypothetical protein